MKIMAVAVHPDDETLGCGGTLLNHARAGHSLHWLLVTAMHPGDFADDAIEIQKKQVEKVRQSYPFATLDWLRLPTTRIESVDFSVLASKIRQSIDAIRPEVVYVPHWSDSHSDHRVIFDVMLSVLKSFYMSRYGVQRVLACEVISETDASAPHVRSPFVPNVFVDITDSIERKLEIFSAYKTEIHPEPGPRSFSAIRAQARFRGAAVNRPCAEAFMLVREIVT